MTPVTEAPKKRALWKAGVVLLAVYGMGILTGVGGGLLVLRHEMHNVMTRPADAPAPVDRILSQFEAEVTRKARLTEPEQALIRERLQAVSRSFKNSRVRFASELRLNLQQETEALIAGIDPERREKVREIIHQRLQSWGLEPPEALKKGETPLAPIALPPER